MGVHILYKETHVKMWKNKYHTEIESKSDVQCGMYLQEFHTRALHLLLFYIFFLSVILKTDPTQIVHFTCPGQMHYL